MEDEGHIQVVCRVRPKNQREQRNSKENFDSSCLEVDENNTTIKIIIKDEIKTFNYDYSANNNVTQEEMFDKIGIPITKSCLKGYNGTILCYGQTGSGKTFTIFGPSISIPDQRNIKLSTRGLVPRILEYLWNHLSNDCTYNFKCSFYEIYQEKIFDLLDQENPKSLIVREDPNLGVYVEGCTEQIVNSLEDAYQVLAIGFSSRHVGETAMNRVSSRSHAIFQLTIEKTHKHYRNGIEINQTISSRFSMVDLAGSERQKDTNATGIRLKEASIINKSLTCLGKVINELSIQSQGNNSNSNGNVNGNNKKRHINYRDSKLTFLLRDSLGGNSKTILIATVSPAEICYQETLSTLYFAQRSRNICNTARVNERISGSIPALQAEILNLRAQIERLSKSSNGFSHDSRKSLSPNHYSPKRQPLTPTRQSENIHDKENNNNNNTPNNNNSKENIPLLHQKNLFNEKHSQTIKLNRELEDLLECKDNIISEKEKEIQLLKEMIEKTQCENEAKKQIEEGRFTHTKILMSTIDELNKVNDNLSIEVQSLRCVRDSLLQNAENEMNTKKELYNQINELTKQKNDLEFDLEFTKKQLIICEDSLIELQKELSICQHQYLDERTRAENFEISLIALKTELKDLTHKNINQTNLNRTSRGSLMISSQHLNNSTISLNNSFQIDNNIHQVNNIENNIDNENGNGNDIEDIEDDWKTISSITEKYSIISTSSETIEKDQSPSAKSQSTFSEENIRINKDEQSTTSSTKRNRTALLTESSSLSIDNQEDEKQPNLISRVLGIFSNKRLRTESFKEPKNIIPPQPINLNCSNVEGATFPNSCIIITWECTSSSSMKGLLTFEIERSVMSCNKDKIFLPYEQICITDRLQYIVSISNYPSSVLRFRVRSQCLGTKSDWSSSVTIRTPSHLVPIQLNNLEFMEPFDNNGVLYWIGTNGRETEYINPYTSGEINISLNCKWYATDAAVYVEHNPTKLIHNPNYPCTWFELDLGSNRQLIPNHYCLRGFEKMKKILKSWELQAKRELNENWITIKSHHNDQSKLILNNQPYPIGSWSISGIKQPYRYFRILQMDHRDKYSNFLTCSGIELYGTLLQTNIEKYQSPQKKLLK